MADLTEGPVAPEQALAGQNLVFVAGGSRFALPADWAAEVVPVRDITALPGAPSYHLGVILLRGEVVPVVDLRVLVAGSAVGFATEVPNPPRAVVARLPKGALAFGADRVLGFSPMEGARAPVTLEEPCVHLLAPVEGEGPILVEPLGLFRFLAASGARKPL